MPIKPETGSYPMKKKKFNREAVEFFKNKKWRKETGNIRLSAIFHFYNNCSCDIDNLAKSLLDSMNGIIYRDDKQIKKLLLEIIENSFIEGISIIIGKI